MIQRRKLSDERGFIGIVTALMLVGLLAFAGLAVDVGYMQFMKRRAQNAADAAAMGALRELELGNTSNLAAAGQADAAMNGFTNGVGNTTVTINNPPLNGNLAGNSLAVEAVVQQTVPSFFMMVVGRNSVPIGARAVGRKTNYVGSIGGCMFALNPTQSGTLTVNGSSMNLNTSCSAVVDSTNSSAFVMGSSVTWNLSNHAKVGVVGGWSLNGGASLFDVANNTSTNPVTTAFYSDPLSLVPVPVVSNYTIQSTSTVTYKKNGNMPSGNTINPGIYCGGINIQDTGGVYLKMNAGTYILAGGGLQANASAMLDGLSGVTIYNTSSTGWGCPSSSPYTAISINGGAVMKMKAPTSGSYVGILMFDDRTVSGNTTINGNSSSSFDGALYFKGSQLTFNGTNSTNGYMVIVADTIKLAGSTTLGNNYTSLSTTNYFTPTTTGSGLSE